MIETTLNRQQAEALFTQECVVFGHNNAIPIFRAVGFFGKSAAEWLEKSMNPNGYLVAGVDYNSWWNGSLHVDYLALSGFLKLVSWHNCTVLLRLNSESEGGAIWNEALRARRECMNALDAEDDCKQAKRAAARKAKQEAQQAIKTTAEPA